MKILYLCIDGGIDLTGQSGGSVHIRAFVRAMTELGHEVTVVCTRAGSPGSLEAELQARVHVASLASWNHALAHGIRAGNRLLGRATRNNPDAVRLLHNLKFYKVAAEAARKLTPHFIYERYSLWGVTGVRLAKRRLIPLVLEVNAPLAYEQQHYRAGLTCAPLARWVERTVWRKAQLVFPVSEALCRKIRKVGATQERVHVLPNAVNPRLFRTDLEAGPVRERFKLDGRFVIGFVGTFKRWHGVDLLLVAFQDIHRADPSAHLLLVGDGPLRSLFEEQVQKAGLEHVVTFAGAVPHQDVPRYLAAMDVTVAPYPALEDFYYSPLKLFEYMAAGRAVVASRAGQVAEVLVDGVTGLLFEPGDHAGLVQCIRRLRHNAALREELGKRASAACSGRTWSQNAACVIDRVQSLIGRKGVNAVSSAVGDQLQHSS